MSKKYGAFAGKVSEFGELLEKKKIIDALLEGTSFTEQEKMKMADELLKRPLEEIQAGDVRARRIMEYVARNREEFMTAVTPALSKMPPDMGFVFLVDLAVSVLRFVVEKGEKLTGLEAPEGITSEHLLHTIPDMYDPFTRGMLEYADMKSKGKESL